jgi:hypothetical protein
MTGAVTAIGPACKGADAYPRAVLPGFAQRRTHTARRPGRLASNVGIAVSLAYKRAYCSTAVGTTLRLEEIN